jgi:hypothetical protein
MLNSVKQSSGLVNRIAKFSMELSKILIIFGAVALFLGIVLNYAPWLVNWFGKLPGDIRIQNERSFIFFPLTSMVVVSLLLMVIINLFFRK